MNEVTQDNLLEVVQALHKDVKEMKDEMNRYKGFLGGIWFVASCVGIFLSAFKFFHKG